MNPTLSQSHILLLSESTIHSWKVQAIDIKTSDPFRNCHTWALELSLIALCFLSLLGAQCSSFSCLFTFPVFYSFVLLAWVALCGLRAVLWFSLRLFSSNSRWSEMLSNVLMFLLCVRDTFKIFYNSNSDWIVTSIYWLSVRVLSTSFKSWIIG